MPAAGFGRGGGVSFSALLNQDLRVARAEASGALLAVQFFAISALIFPLGLGPETGMLARAGPGLLAVMACIRHCLRSTGCSGRTMKTAL